MKSKKINLFKLVNVLMVAFCICAAAMNYVGVHVVNADTATSLVNGNTFEYKSSNNEFSFTKNGQLIGRLYTDRKFDFYKSNLPLYFNCNLVGAGIAAAAGASVDVIGSAIGGAVAGGAALAEVPGAAAVSATLGGAGAVAAEAAATAGAMSVGATVAAALAPVAFGALIVGGVA